MLMKIYLPKGFSLVELLTVFTIVSFLLLAVSHSISHLENRKYNAEINRFANVIKLVVDRTAIIKRSMVIDVFRGHYQVREKFRGSWNLINTGILKPYHFKTSLRFSKKKYLININSKGFTERHKFYFYDEKDLSKKYFFFINELGQVSVEKSNEL